MTNGGARLLVVDDDPDISETVSLVLELNGYCVTPAMDGLDALEKIRRGPAPAAILVDIMMPRMNGVDFVKALRADPALARIPVILLSGDTSAGRTAAALAVEGYLPKPVEVDDLLGAVQRVLSRDAA
jgi:two-component system, chemotaxis family, chemotaxis protein CheY